MKKQKTPQEAIQSLLDGLTKEISSLEKKDKKYTLVEANKEVAERIKSEIEVNYEKIVKLQKAENLDKNLFGLASHVPTEAQVSNENKLPIKSVFQILGKAEESSSFPPHSPEESSSGSEGSPSPNKEGKPVKYDKGTQTNMEPKQKGAVLPSDKAPKLIGGKDFGHSNTPIKTTKKLMKIMGDMAGSPATTPPPAATGVPDDSLARAEVLSKPPVSEAQRGAMHAAAAGKSTIGIPKKVGEEFSEADKGGKLPEHKKSEESSDSLSKAGVFPATKVSPAITTIPHLKKLIAPGTYGQDDFQSMKTQSGVPSPAHTAATKVGTGVPQTMPKTKLATGGAPASPAAKTQATNLKTIPSLSQGAKTQVPLGGTGNTQLGKTSMDPATAAVKNAKMPTTQQMKPSTPAPAPQMSMPKPGLNKEQSFENSFAELDKAMGQWPTPQDNITEGARARDYQAKGADFGQEVKPQLPPDKAMLQHPAPVQAAADANANQSYEQFPNIPGKHANAFHETAAGPTGVHGHRGVQGENSFWQGIDIASDPMSQFFQKNDEMEASSSPTEGSGLCKNCGSKMEKGHKC